MIIFVFQLLLPMLQRMFANCLFLVFLQTEIKFLLHIYFWINFIFFIIYMDTCEVDSKVTITNLYCNCLDLCHWKKNENFLIISRLFWMTNFVFCISQITNFKNFGKSQKLQNHERFCQRMFLLVKWHFPK